MAKIVWKSKSEIEEEAVEKEEMTKVEEARNRVMEKMLEKYVLSEDLPEDELDDVIQMYPPWKPGQSYKAGEKVRYNNSVMEVVQDHTSQEDWKPDLVPALYTVFRQKKTEDGTTIVEEWVQPTGVHDAYGIGDKVMFEGKVYESVVDDNVWSPTDYPQGWKELVT